MTEKVTIRIGDAAKVETWRDGEWTILYVEDGSGAKTTVSLRTLQALDLAKLLRGYGISAASIEPQVPVAHVDETSKPETVKPPKQPPGDEAT